MSRIDRIRHTATTHRSVRSGTGGAETRGQANLPVPVGPVVRAVPPIGETPNGGDAGFNAQLMGQDGQRRGLRAGPAFIDNARTAYNRVEFSGSWDRRARSGRRALTDI